MYNCTVALMKKKTSLWGKRLPIRKKKNSIKEPQNFFYYLFQEITFLHQNQNYLILEKQKIGFANW